MNETIKALQAAFKKSERKDCPHRAFAYDVAQEGDTNTPYCRLCGQTFTKEELTALVNARKVSR